MGTSGQRQTIFQELESIILYNLFFFLIIINNLVRRMLRFCLHYSLRQKRKPYMAKLTILSTSLKDA